MNFNQDTSSPIKFTPGKDSSYSSNSDVGTRPTGDPRGRKDFKKVLEKTDDGDEDSKKSTQSVDEGDEPVAAEEGIKKKGPPSLFDLTSGKTTVDSLGSQSTGFQVAEAGKAVSPSALYAKMTEDPKAPNSRIDTGDIQPEGLPLATGKDKFTTRFATEQSDLSYINPLATAPNQLSSTAVAGDKPVLPVSNIQDLVRQLVERVVELKDGGKTETTITLRHPPLFAGANIVVTSYESAKGEFNIAFENLTQAGKNVLDLQANRDSLLQALERRGYAVHILTTTTIDEHKTVVADIEPKERPRQGAQEFGEDQQKRQRR